MTASELKYQVEQAGRLEHFFTRGAMQFFGDTMKNYGVCSDTIPVKDYDTEEVSMVKVWVLYRKHAVKYGIKTSVYFRQDNFNKVFLYTQEV